MTSIVLGIGIVLVIIILGLIFRVQSLISIVRGSHDKRDGLSNKINAALFPIFLVGGGFFAFYSAYHASSDFLPEAVSEHGVRTDQLFWITMAIIGVVFVITHILLFYFPFKYQFNVNRKAEFYPDNTRLEIIWTVIPAIVLAALVFSGIKVWTDITSESNYPKDPVTLEIMGKQFNWLVRYPGIQNNKLGHRNYKLIDATNEMGIDFSDESSFDDFMPGSEIHIPKGKPVLFKIAARDVLHSVYAPHFRLKMDAVPGMPTKFWFVPTKSTAEMRSELQNPNFNYEIACTEVCGRGHFGMKLTLVVDEEDDYNRWVASKKPFLLEHQEYLAKVPSNLKEKAIKSLGIVSTDSTSALSTGKTSEVKAILVSNK